MDDLSWTREAAEQLYPRLSEFRIGSRIDFEGTDFPHTLVGIRIDPSLRSDRFDLFPLYVNDDHVEGRDNQFALLEGEDIDDPAIRPAPDDPEKASAARAWAIREREYLTNYGFNDVLFDMPASADQLRRWLIFCKADREWREAAQLERQAAKQRSEAVAQIAWTDGTQSSAARILGYNQSTVSRAVAAVTPSSEMAP
ncbi:hypothetical protein ABZ829_28230 [Streptomyces xanthochromogenes]|uniref:hypothetical protein n=1 Tax=Streptomyces xanthochromogenes TaxID=67384 RepID=UPI003436519D